MAQKQINNLIYDYRTKKKRLRWLLEQKDFQERYTKEGFNQLSDLACDIDKIRLVLLEIEKNMDKETLERVKNVRRN